MRSGAGAPSPSRPCTSGAPSHRVFTPSRRCGAPTPCTPPPGAPQKPFEPRSGAPRRRPTDLTARDLGCKFAAPLMLQAIEHSLSAASGFLWSYILLFCLLGTHIYLTIILRFRSATSSPPQTLLRRQQQERRPHLPLLLPHDLAGRQRRHRQHHRRRRRRHHRRPRSRLLVHAHRAPRHVHPLRRKPALHPATACRTSKATSSAAPCTSSSAA